MADEQAPTEASKGFPIKELWEKYEEIAMHFNDLLIKLRTQALGAVAAISALVGVFSKTETGLHSWEISSAVFLFLCAFWVAIWVIDFRYYNLLLLGAVDAIVDLEEISNTATHVSYIDISTKIERAVAGERQRHHAAPRQRYQQLVFGRWAFYLIVFGALLFGLAVSLYQVGLISWFCNALSGIWHTFRLR